LVVSPSLWPPGTLPRRQPEFVVAGDFIGRQPEFLIAGDSEKQENPFFFKVFFLQNLKIPKKQFNAQL
jgi:hypothetical protein